MNNVSLVLDLTEWVAVRPRTYREAMTAWRTSCPRLTIWEDAIDAGLVRLCDGVGTEPTVVVTPKGIEFMGANGRFAPRSAPDLTTMLAALEPRARIEVLWSRSNQRFSIATYVCDDLPAADVVTSVRALVSHEGKYVALTNPDGQHLLPGGRIERNETYEQALRREIREETGLNVTDARRIGFLHLRHLTPKPDGYDYPFPDMVHLVYHANGAGVPRSGDPDGWEHDLSLVSLTEAREINGNEHVHPFLEHIAAQLDR